MGKVEFTGPNKILGIYFYIVLNKNCKNLLVQTNVYWCWALGPVLIMKIVTIVLHTKYKSLMAFQFLFFKKTFFSPSQQMIK